MINHRPNDAPRSIEATPSLAVYAHTRAGFIRTFAWRTNITLQLARQQDNARASQRISDWSNRLNSVEFACAQVYFSLLHNTSWTRSAHVRTMSALRRDLLYLTAEYIVLCTPQTVMLEVGFSRK